MRKIVFAVLLFGVALLLNISSVTAANITTDQVANASGSVKSCVETNHTLPSSVNISGTRVNMPQFLEISTTAVLNINNGSNATIALRNYNSAPTPTENITSGNISSAEYLDIAKRVKSFMDSNGRAPNYASSSLGKIRYESLVYMYAQILKSYNINNKTLPDYITVNPWTIVLNPNVIGNTSYGYVEKEFYGNQSSNQTIVLIIGVHPQESGIHTAIANALANKSTNLSKRYVIYKIHVTQDADDYSKGRMNGQLLAQFIVPDVHNESPMLVLDNHENHGANSGYDYYRFLYPISNTTITTTYANEIIGQMSFLVIYSPLNPTSTEYVTVPIANQGITTIIYETYFYDSETKKAADANALIDALDGLDSESNTSTDSTGPTVTTSPTGGSFNTIQTVTLTTTDPDSTAITYYTMDGSDPRTSSTRTEYVAPIEINSNTTLRFSATDPAGNWSPIYNETYVIDTTIPTATVNPAGGAYNSTQNVELSTEPGATVYYTTDGSDPRTSSKRSVYSNLIPISTTTILRFSAVNAAGNWGPIYNETYVIDTTAPTVTANPAGGNYYGPQNVVLAANEISEIYYTIDGKDPTKDSKKCTGHINVETSKTLKFTAWDNAGNQSLVYSESYMIYKPEPYSYTVSVPYKKVKYKSRYKRWYKKWYKKRYKSKGKWKYYWKYKWKYKWKCRWFSRWIYKNETRWDNHWVLT